MQRTCSTAEGQHPEADRWLAIDSHERLDAGGPYPCSCKKKVLFFLARESRDRPTIRRVIRGIYDRPRFSEALSTELSPDLDQVAQALARKFGWRIQPSGAVAQNLLRLSTQVPARAVYLSDGPNRSYQVGRTALVFDHTALKEAGFKLPESRLIVQALKSLGQEHVTPEVISTIREWLAPNLRRRVLADTETATGWVYAALRRIAGRDTDGSSRESSG